MPVRSIVALVLCLSFTSTTGAADAFDQYTNFDLQKAIETKAVKEVKDLLGKTLTDHSGVLRGTTATMLIVRTSDNRIAKLLVQPARQKIGDATPPILLIERYVTFREGTERAIQATGQNVQLYPNFYFNLDLGQVVPANVTADLSVMESAVGSNQIMARPGGKAKIYLVTSAPPATVAPKSARPVVGESFETRYFDGAYKLQDDGRRSGMLTIHADEAGEVSGSFVSDKDGQKYDVKGKVGNPRHAIQFTIKFPRVEQAFQGYLFTGDARALAGSSKLQEREAGFYAVRIED